MIRLTTAFGSDIISFSGQLQQRYRDTEQIFNRMREMLEGFQSSACQHSSTHPCYVSRDLPAQNWRWGTGSCVQTPNGRDWLYPGQPERLQTGPECNLRAIPQHWAENQSSSSPKNVIVWGFRKPGKGWASTVVKERCEEKGCCHHSWWGRCWSTTFRNPPRAGDFDPLLVQQWQWHGSFYCWPGQTQHLQQSFPCVPKRLLGYSTGLQRAPSAHSCSCFLSWHIILGELLMKTGKLTLSSFFFKGMNPNSDS